MVEQIAHQRIIRDTKQEEYSGELSISSSGQMMFGLPVPEMDIKEAVVRPCTYSQAKAVIIEYEWLGTMPQRTTHTFGIFYDNQIAGVACFAVPPTPDVAGAVAGNDYADDVKVLARGACVWWAHPHSASKLISGALDHMIKNTRFKYFVAYADYRAGEIGTVYQATNWLYTGTTSGDVEFFYEGRWRSSRAMRHKSLKIKQVNYLELPRRKGNKKHRYIFIGGKSKSEKKKLRQSLKYPVLPYPKRDNEESWIK